MAAVKRSVSVNGAAPRGVSEQTVSRTVHNSPSVRPETKERVRAAMRELGYRPNFAGRRFAAVSLRPSASPCSTLPAPAISTRMEGFAAAADKHGYAIHLTKVDWASLYPRERIVAHERTSGGWHGCDYEPHAGGLWNLRAAAQLQTVLVTMLDTALFNGR